MTTRLLAVALLTCLIHLINTLIYSVRPAGVLTRRLATAYSLFNVVFLLAQTANMLQAPLLSSIVEQAINRGQKAAGALTHNVVQTPFYQHELASLNTDIRMVILAATLGTLVGTIFIPSFIKVFIKAIMVFDQTKSVPKMVLSFLSPGGVKKQLNGFKVPDTGTFRETRKHKANLPKTFLFLNFFVTGIYTTGVLSALYAGALFPEFRATATLLSGIINGFATIMFATVVDPTAAMITDQALREERPEQDVKKMSLYLGLTRMGGTLFAQLIFVPAAFLVQEVARLIAS